MKTNNNIELIPIDQIESGPIVHRTLSDQMLAQIKEIHEFEKQFCGGTLEECELDFMRDLFPEKEIAVWLRIKRKHERFMLAHPKADPKKVCF